MRNRTDRAEKPRVRRVFQRDGENRVIVNMTVKDDSDFLSVFSESDTPVISTEVADFIENSTSSIHPKEKLTLRIHSSCIDDAEKALYREAISEYYTEKYVAEKRELRRNNVISLLLMLAGILVLGYELFFDCRIGNLIWTEVIDIVAWVLLWEAADISILENRAIRVKCRRCLTYASMRIEYAGLPERQGSAAHGNA